VFAPLEFDLGVQINYSLTDKPLFQQHLLILHDLHICLSILELIPHSSFIVSWKLSCLSASLSTLFYFKTVLAFLFQHIYFKIILSNSQKEKNMLYFFSFFLSMNSGLRLASQAFSPLKPLHQPFLCDGFFSSYGLYLPGAGFKLPSE
jgi:hypothetical protein